MPELPEVETVARTLRPHVRGREFTRATLLRASSLHPLSLPPESLVGRKIRDVGRRGKLLKINLDGDGRGAAVPQYLILHLRMTGRVFAAKANAEQGKHTRCVFELRDPDGSRTQLFFDDIRAFGQIFIATDESLAQWKFWRELGPEPLTLNLADFSERFKGGRAVKQALLDQRFVAGLGNIYVDESLFKAGVRPERPLSSITAAEKEKLLSAIREILATSISQRGSSIRDYRDADGNVGAFQNSFSVYGRGGEKCPRCGAVLAKIRVGGRATVFCPDCQK